MRILHRMARRTRLERELAAHDRNEADLAALGRDGCKCKSQELPGGHLRIDLCDQHTFICDPDGDT